MIYTLVDENEILAFYPMKENLTRGSNNKVHCIH